MYEVPSLPTIQQNKYNFEEKSKQQIKGFLLDVVSVNSYQVHSGASWKKRYVVMISQTFISWCSTQLMFGVVLMYENVWVI